MKSQISTENLSQLILSWNRIMNQVRNRMNRKAGIEKLLLDMAYLDSYLYLGTLTWEWKR